MSQENQSVEQLIVATVKTQLTAAPLSDRKMIYEALAAVGVILQPFDLDVVLSRHPALFRLNYRAEWRLA